MVFFPACLVLYDRAEQRNAGPASGRAVRTPQRRRGKSLGKYAQVGVDSSPSPSLVADTPLPDGCAESADDEDFVVIDEERVDAALRAEQSPIASLHRWLLQTYLPWLRRPAVQLAVVIAFVGVAALGLLVAWPRLRIATFDPEEYLAAGSPLIDSMHALTENYGGIAPEAWGLNVVIKDVDFNDAEQLRAVRELGDALSRQRLIMGPLLGWLPAFMLWRAERMLNTTGLRLREVAAAEPQLESAALHVAAPLFMASAYDRDVTDRLVAGQRDAVAVLGEVGARFGAAHARAILNLFTTPPRPRPPFVADLRAFLASAEGAKWSHFVRLSADGSRVDASLIFGTLRVPEGEGARDTNFQMFEGLRDTLAASDVRGYASSALFEPVYTLYRLKSILAANVASGVACCCLLLALLVREPTAVALGTAAMLMVSADMFGALLLLRIPVNIVTVFSLLFATGLSVDSIGHVAHSLAGHGARAGQHADGTVRAALLHSAAPVLLAVLTSVVAFLPTFAAITPTLLQYTLILISLLLLSLLHAVLFIPAAFLLIARAKRRLAAAATRRARPGAAAGGNGVYGRRHAGSPAGSTDGCALLELSRSSSSASLSSSAEPR